MIRAAVLSASPRDEYVLRNGGPESPEKTRPELTPIRIGSSSSCSITKRAVRSIRSSSFPRLTGGSGDQQDLAPVSRDIGLGIDDLVPVSGLLNGEHELLDRSGERVGPSALEERVGALELDERRRDRPVLGVAAAREEVLANPSGRQSARSSFRTSGTGGDPRLAVTGSPGEEKPCVPGRPDGVGREQGRCRPAHDDFTGLRNPLHRDGLRGIRACDHELAVAMSDEEEVEARRSEARSTCGA